MPGWRGTYHKGVKGRQMHHQRTKRALEAAQRANEAARKIANPQCVTPVNAEITLLWHSANNTAAIHLGRYNVRPWRDNASRQLKECIRNGCAMPEFAERIRLIPDMDFIGHAVVLSQLDYEPLIDLIEKIGEERAWAVLIAVAEPESVPVTSGVAAVEQIRSAVARKEVQTRQEIIEKHNKLVPDAVLGRKFSSGRKPGTPSPLKKLVQKKIEALMKKGIPASKIKPAELWRQFSDRPPRGFEFVGDVKKIEDAFEGAVITKLHRDRAFVTVNSNQKEVPYKRFANIVSEVKAGYGPRKKPRKRRKIPD